MVDARTVEERERDRREALKEAERQRQAEIQRQQDEQRGRELAIREQEAITQRESAEAEKLKRQAQIEFAKAVALVEENKKTALNLRATVAKEEYYYQKNRRAELDRLSDTNWIEQQRHERNLELDDIKRNIVEIEAEARKFEASKGADEIAGLLSALDRM